ncbi:MAG TPA: hypothetical protein VHP38_11215 [Ruminiclostridium sp.]|nr:hypothetical protein [Ruminiclostridium sp.]
MNDDDLSKKIQQIAELLGQENMPDNVKGLLSMLSGSLAGKDDSAEKAAETTQEKDERHSPPEVREDDSELLSRAKKMMEKLNTGNDPRVNLLYAIKPFMNNKRQQKIGNCIKILQIASLTKLIDFNDK